MNHLGPFQLEGLIGSGGQADVYRAVHRPSGTPVAVKRTRPSFAAADFQRELGVLADLDHEHIVRLWGAGTEPDAQWFAMELAQGTLADTTLDWASIVCALEAVLAALAHVHARQILHLDLKPANVLVGCSDGADELASLVPGLRLSDFGLAMRLGSPHQRAGTVGFAAPEQLQGLALGPETDLYAVGQLAWFLVTGATAFRHDDSAEEIRAQIRGVPPVLTPRLQVPAGFEDWARWLLEPSPSHRPHRAIEASAALPRELGTWTAGSPQAAPKMAGRSSAGPAPATVVLEDPTSAAGAPSGEPAGPVRRSVWASWRVRQQWGRVRWLLNGGLGPVASRHPRFVGRATERAHLWRLLREVRDGAGTRGVVLRGPSGAGTSRLAAWLGGRTHEADVGWPLEVRHSERGGPGEGIVAALLGLVGGGVLRGEARHRSLRVLAARLGVASETWPERMLAALDGVLDPADPLSEAELRERPLVLVVDDARYGSETLALGARLVARGAPVLLVLVASDGDGPATDLLRSLGFPELRLGPLQLDELDRLQQWTGLSTDLAQDLAVASNGMPGPFLDLLRTLDGAGSLRSSPEGLVVDGPLPSLLSPPAFETGDDLHELVLSALLGTPVDAPRWRSTGLASPTGHVEDPRVLAAAIRALGPEMPEVWATAAAQATTPTLRALYFTRAGRIEQARTHVEEVVWQTFAPADLATVAVAREVRDQEHPASRLLSLAVRLRCGHLRGLTSDALALSERMPPDSRELAHALEIAAAGGVDLLPRDELGRLEERAEALYRLAGDELSTVRMQLRRLRAVQDLRERVARLLPHLHHPVHRVTVLSALCRADQAWYEALVNELQSGTDPWHLGEAQRVLAEAASERGQFDRASEHLAQARRSVRSSQQTFRLVVVLSAGDLAYRERKFEDALDAYLEGTEVLESLGLDTTEAQISIAATLLAMGGPAATRARLPPVKPHQHPLAIQGIRLLRFVMELSAGPPPPDIARRWAALWEGEAGRFASNEDLRMYRHLVDDAAAREGLVLRWPGDPDSVPIPV